MNIVSKEKLQEIFKVYVQKPNNVIKTQDIGKLIRSARMFPTQADIVELQRKVDPKKNGSFSITTFVQVGLQFAEKQAKVNHQQELIKAFSFFDEEQNGYILESDLRKIMSAFGQPLTQQQTKQILKYSKAVNGKINYKDFAKTIIKGKFQ